MDLWGKLHFYSSFLLYEWRRLHTSGAYDVPCADPHVHKFHITPDNIPQRETHSWISWVQGQFDGIFYTSATKSNGIVMTTVHKMPKCQTIQQTNSHQSTPCSSGLKVKLLEHLKRRAKPRHVKSFPDIWSTKTWQLPKSKGTMICRRFWPSEPSFVEALALPFRYADHHVAHRASEATWWKSEFRKAKFRIWITWIRIH